MAPTTTTPPPPPPRRRRRRPPALQLRLLVPLLLLLLALQPPAAHAFTPTPAAGRRWLGWRLVATVDDARVGAPVADAAPPPSPAAAAAAVGRGKGKGKSKERAPGSVSNSEITARLMHPRATAAEILALVRDGQDPAATFSAHNLVTALQRLAKLATTQRGGGGGAASARRRSPSIADDPRLEALVLALAPHLPTLSPEQLGTCLYALGRLGCARPLLLKLPRGQGEAQQGQQGPTTTGAGIPSSSSVLGGLTSAFAAQMGRCDARVLSTAIHGAARLFPLILLASATSTEADAMGGAQQQQQQQQQAHALLSLLVDGFTQRVVAAAGTGERKESSGSNDSEKGKGKGKGKQAGAPNKRRGGGNNGNGVAVVSSQDLAMALSSLGRVAAPPPPSPSSSPLSQQQPPQQYFQPPAAFVAAVLSLLPRHLNTISPSDLAMVVSGLARLLHPPNPTPPSLPTALAHAVMARLDLFKHAWELSAAVEGLHALGVPPQGPMMAALRRMGQSDIRIRQWEAAHQQQEDEQDDEWQATTTAEQEEEEEGEESLVLNRLITACAPDPGALLALAAAHAEGLSPVNAATLLNRLARVRLPTPVARRALLNDPRFQAFARRLPLLLPGMAPRALANAVHALAKLRYHPDAALVRAAARMAAQHAPAFNPAELAMAVQGLARLLPLALAAQTAPTDPTDISSNSNGSDKSPHLSLTPPALLPRLAAALARTLRKPPPKQTRADDGLLGSPHLALTIAGLPPLARAAAAKTNNNAADGSTAAANAFRSPEFLDLVIARVEERGGGMQAWEREMVVEGLRALGVAPASVPPSVLLAAGKEGGG